ncbi:MAG: hypothetical protein D6795_19265, partial [Deltaproteobacteria bacterium]
MSGAGIIPNQKFDVAGPNESKGCFAASAAVRRPDFGEEKERTVRHGRSGRLCDLDVRREVKMERHVRIVGNIFIAKGFLSFFWVVFSVAF